MLRVMVDFFRRNDDSALSQIPVKANRLIYLLLTILLLIGLRIWHLSVIQHDKKCVEAFRPRRKVIVESSERGTIRDRFNTLLAINKMEYRASIVYSEMRAIPTTVIDPKTKKKRYLRREYIKSFSKMVAKELGIDEARLEDIVHSHAALYDTIPYVIKNGLTEEEYYRLKAREKDFPGLQLQRLPKRHYPQGKIGSHLIGYLGPIQKAQYDKLIFDIRELSEYIKSVEFGLDEELPANISSFPDAKRKLFELQERAYTLNDSIGITGAEASFEEELRGYAGKRIYFSDAKGNFVRKMLGSHPPLSGKRLLLSISIELQEFTEKLLAQNEKDREIAYLRDKNGPKEPSMRGGAIVALDPNTGDVVAMASYPRFNPNDFVDKEKESEAKILRWIENEAFIAKVWDRSYPLIREYNDDASRGSWKSEEVELTWKRFLDLSLPDTSPIVKHLSPDTSIQDVIVLQRAFDEILKRAPALSPLEVIKLLSEKGIEPDARLFQEDIAPYTTLLDRWFSTLGSAEEKLLLLDLSRLILCHEDFSQYPELVQALQNLSIDEFRTLSCEYVQLSHNERKKARLQYHDEFFIPWRQENEKAFLQVKRLKEKQEKRQARPYLDYLDKVERAQFEEFWKKERYEYVRKRVFLDGYKLKDTLARLDEGLIIPFLRTLKGFSDLEHALYGRYKTLGGQQAKFLAQSFMKTASASPLRSYAFRQSTIQGSIFKLVTAYAGLKQQYVDMKGQCSSKDLRLFELSDHTFKDAGRVYVGSFPDGKAIPQLYKGGRIPKSLHHNIGKIDLIRAIETSSNPYFSIMAGDFLHDPEDLAEVARGFGYGTKTKIRLPGEITGNIPNDLRTNKTGLYATAIGQHTLITTPLQTAVMLSAIANGGKVLEPKIALLTAGKGLSFERKVSDKKDFPYKKSLALVGIDFPLFSVAAADSKNEVTYFPTLVKNELFFPEIVRSTILEGMRRSVQRALDDQGALLRLYAVHPTMRKDFMGLKGQFVGKTSTAEVIERVGFDVTSPSKMYRHIWFGGISFSQGAKEDEASPSHSFLFSDPYGKLELVVVVYLRYGGYGKEAAPIAAQVVQKWREISD